MSASRGRSPRRPALAKPLRLPPRRRCRRHPSAHPPTYRSHSPTTATTTAATTASLDLRESFPSAALLRAYGSLIPQVLRAPLWLPELAVSHLFCSSAAAALRVRTHYRSHALKGAYKALFALDALGNPVGALSSVREGFRDLLYEPSAVTVRSPLGVTSGAWEVAGAGRLAACRALRGVGVLATRSAVRRVAVRGRRARVLRRASPTPPGATRAAPRPDPPRPAGLLRGGRSFGRHAVQGVSRSAAQGLMTLQKKCVGAAAGRRTKHGGERYLALARARLPQRCSVSQPHPHLPTCLRGGSRVALFLLPFQP